MYLLDTHTLLWAFDNTYLKPRITRILKNSDNICFVSPVSAYEINLKINLGKLAPIFKNDNEFLKQLNVYAFHLLPITFSHTLAAGALPLHHRDPFDRMLIAQAQIERLTLITNDPAFENYDVTTVW